MKVVESIASQCRISSTRSRSLHQGRTIFTAGYGFRDIPKGQFPDDETIYSLASISKTFVVAAFGPLVAEGKVRWTDVVGNYIPEFHPEGDSYLRRRHSTTSSVIPGGSATTWFQSTAPMEP